MPQHSQATKFRRHDFDVEIMGASTAVHYISEYMRVALKIMAPARHRIFPGAVDGHAPCEPVPVPIDVSEIAFA